MKTLIRWANEKLEQRQHTKWHRKWENDAGSRLTILDGYGIPTYLGRRSWCDAKLVPCVRQGHSRCCECTHLEATPDHTEAQ